MKNHVRATALLTLLAPSLALADMDWGCGCGPKKSPYLHDTQDTSLPGACEGLDEGDSCARRHDGSEGNCDANGTCVGDGSIDGAVGGASAAVVFGLTLLATARRRV